MKASFFARRSRIPGLSNGLLIMMIVCFLVPFALRGSKMVTQRMENDIKDWLPGDFPETRELEWFGKLFLGEQFIVITWEGCSEEDPSYQLFVDKLKAELVIPEGGRPWGESADRKRQQQLEEARELGQKLGLYTSSEWRKGGRRERDNWGGEKEKWLKDLDGLWYYLLPDGSLYEWSGRDNLVDGIKNQVHHDLLKNFVLEGTLVGRLGDRPDPPFEHNEFYDNPQLVCARYFTSVRTGPDVLEELAGVGGPLRPRGNVDLSEEQLVAIAYRDGIDRLTGTLFAPAVPEGFSWTADQVRAQLDEERLAALPDDWEVKLEQFVSQLVTETYEGDHQEFLKASSLPRARHWDALCEQLQIDPPPRQTSIVVTLSDYAKQDLQRVVGRGLLENPAGRLVEIAVECGLAAPVMPGLTPWADVPDPDGIELRMGGPPVDNGAIDEEGQVTLQRLVGLSLLLGIVLSFLAFRSIKVTFMVFFVGGASAVMSLGIVWYTGGSADAILMSMPSLVYVLGLSGAVHIVNYYRDAVLEDGPDGAAERALSHGWWPCTLASFTTSLGLLSLYNSGLIPIKKFGLFSAIGVMASVILLFSYLPAALTTWPPRFSGKKKLGGENKSRPPKHSLLTRCWMWIGRGITRHWGLAMAGCLVIMIGSGIGLLKINTSVQLLKLFDGNAKIVKDYEWLEEHRGKLVPMEVVVHVDRDFQLPLRDQLPDLAAMPVAERNRMKYQYSFLERLELIDRIQSAVETVFGEDGQQVIGHGMSATSFAPPFPPPGARTQRSSTNALMERNRNRLMDEDYLAIDSESDQMEIWRISLRLGALNDVNYGQFVDQLREVVDPIVDAYGFRNWLLEKIEAERGSSDRYNSPNVFFDDNRILVLGAHPRGSIVDMDETAGSEIDRYHVNQHQLFVRTFNDLMRIKGFSNRFGHPSELYWVDPSEDLFSDKLAQWSEQDWAQFLAKYNYVILVADHPLLDRSIIRRHAGELIDAVPAEPGSMVADSTRGESGVEMTYTGTVPIVYKAQTELLQSLKQSIGMAFGMICVVMIFLLRNGPKSFSRVTFWVPAIAFAVVAIPLHLALGAPILIAGLAGLLVVSMVCFGNITGGLVSMIPNIFPVVVIFGLMGHAGVMVDIGSMMTASVAMGVAVDDTIHFLNWFRLGLNKGLDRGAAVEQSYQRCAAAMTQTTLIGGLGLSVFAISTFTPTQRFGVLMLTLLTAALVGDLIFLPALLVSPLGRFFSPAKKNKQKEPLSRQQERTSEEESSDGPQPHLGAGKLQRHDPPHHRKPD
ncbi:MAG: MMPL family transporter [Planctomycetota bacterium]|nr:MMPL family transporter [Planctomycetota bacterium]